MKSPVLWTLPPCALPNLLQERRKEKSVQSLRQKENGALKMIAKMIFYKDTLSNHVKELNTDLTITIHYVI